MLASQVYGPLNVRCWRRAAFGKKVRLERKGMSQVQRNAFIFGGSELLAGLEPRRDEQPPCRQGTSLDQRNEDAAKTPRRHPERSAASQPAHPGPMRRMEAWPCLTRCSSHRTGRIPHSIAVDLIDGFRGIEAADDIGALRVIRDSDRVLISSSRSLSGSTRRRPCRATVISSRASC